MKAINVYPRLFGGPLRAGDMLAACNFLEYIRMGHYQGTDIRLYIPHESIYSQDHCMDMFLTLLETTDYITQCPDELLELHVIPGTDPTYSDMYNIFNIRKNTLHQRQNLFFIDDDVRIPNKDIRNDNKVVIVPLLDAPYNNERNWSPEYTQKLLNYYCHCADLEMIIASKNPIPFDIGHARYSHNYIETLKHIRECGIFVGGDTGLSHYAGALEPGPSLREYHYSHKTYGTTNPMRWAENGTMIYY